MHRHRRLLLPFTTNTLLSGRGACATNARKFYCPLSFVYRDYPSLNAPTVMNYCMLIELWYFNSRSDAVFAPPKMQHPLNNTTRGGARRASVILSNLCKKCRLLCDIKYCVYCGCVGGCKFCTSCNKTRLNIDVLLRVRQISTGELTNCHNIFI